MLPSGSCQNISPSPRQSAYPSLRSAHARDSTRETAPPRRVTGSRVSIRWTRTRCSSWSFRIWRDLGWVVSESSPDSRLRCGHSAAERRGVPKLVDVYLSSLQLTYLSSLSILISSNIFSGSQLKPYIASSVPKEPPEMRASTSGS